MSSGTTGQINYFNSLIGREINRAYKIDEQLAVGGMGAVFRATRYQNGECVAIKVISPHLAANSVFVKRFQREAKVGFLLSHPHIVKVYEFGETPEGLLFMVMEFIQGQTLGYYLERNAPFTVTRCLEILKPLCQALDAAHQRNILHRDLKPANILVAKDSSDRETVKLVDFGLVKLLEPDNEITQGSTNLTGMGEACGTPYYMSPEQIIGQPLSPTADIYSLGVIIYQMLTGKLPIESSSIRQILSIKINQDLPPPSEKFPFIPTTLDRVLQKSMARNPRNRYQTAGELLADFQRVTAEITAEFSQPTEPSLGSAVVTDVRKEFIETNEPKVDKPDPANISTITPPPRNDPGLPPNTNQTKMLLLVIGVLSVLLLITIALLFLRQ
jgi:eukaryotic-like serine/threonine-protein kinase